MIDIEVSFDGGRIDVIFSADDGIYTNNTITLEQAMDLSDELRDTVNNMRGDRSPRVFDAEQIRLEETLHAINTLQHLSSQSGKAVDALQEWLNNR